METGPTKSRAAHEIPLKSRNRRAGSIQVATWENEGGSLRIKMNTIQAKDTRRAFQPGDRIVILYNGLYNGMSGRFHGIRQDPEWVDIELESGMVRAYPVQWLRHAREFDKARPQPA